MIRENIGNTLQQYIDRGYINEYNVDVPAVAPMRDKCPIKMVLHAEAMFQIEGDNL